MNLLRESFEPVEDILGLRRVFLNLGELWELFVWPGFSSEVKLIDSSNTCGQSLPAGRPSHGQLAGESEVHQVSTTARGLFVEASVWEWYIGLLEI